MLCLQKKWSEKPSRPKRASSGQASACRQPGNILRKQDIRGDTKICSHKYNGITGTSTQKTRSHKQARGFRNAESAENAPASAFLVLNLRITDETPRKCEAWASIFVEMYALHFVPSLESQPFKISHGLSFCFLWSLSCLFLSRKKTRKKVTKKLHGLNS